ncbi:MAG: CaiB/BaiF CoA transferase family protein [Candidatus Binataceae bacterium]
MKIRALDISMGWAGPLVTQMLGEMPGVEVIKVEDTRNFDWWRGSLSMGPPELQPIERAPTFNTANRGKLGVTLDLGNPRGVEILKRLVKVSDLMVENFAPGVIERLGLGWPVVAALNRRIIMLSMPAFGSDGPEANARGYGMTMEAMAGVTGLCAYHDSDRPYMLENALGDPVTGLNGTFAVMTALWERERTGRGQRIEIAQVEDVIPFLGAQLIEFQLTDELPRRHGNRHPRHAPHGIYRCAGEDNWIALAVATEEQWQKLVNALGLARFAADPRFQDAAARKANHDALDAELNAALKDCSAEETMERLVAAGVMAGTVNSPPQVLADRQIAARAFFVPVERAVVGTHLYPGSVAHLPSTPLDPSRPAPLLGQHNTQVMVQILGMSEIELQELEQAGIIGTRPRQFAQTAQPQAAK